MSKTSSLGAAAIGAVFLTTPLAVHAQTAVPIADTGLSVKQSDMVEEVGSAARIDLSGKLRMLSQRVPSALCAMGAGTAGDSARAILVAAIEEERAILSALADGDDRRGIFGAEDSPKLLRGIERIAEVADPVLDRATTASEHGATAEDVTFVQEQSAEILTRAKQLVVVISDKYANPAELLLADAVAIDIAGRQRMLAQRMAKDFCLLASGHGDQALADDLAQTMQTFEASLDALRLGMPEAGIVEPPTDAIRFVLEEVEASWTLLSGLLVTYEEDGGAGQNQRDTVFFGMNALTAKMNTAVGLYAEASDLDL
ncbi:type IV pili methyl-accepting chemotaxis transducer N-terminal domain-containing protein [Jannaschia sp.]|nr:type IV pili methyl-accepting chemotaxis transducer N-terminal domain-containing protein [Jannaschia sp.]